MTRNDLNPLYGAVSGAALGGIWSVVQTAFDARPMPEDREHEIRRLERMSDASLRQLGVRRGDIARHVYAR